MALLERYLHTVRRHLPAGQQDDIVAELRDDIQAAFDERAEGLGRALTEDEEAALLRPYGRPIVLASRYRKRAHLVGPDWFPFYWNTLKIALSVALIVHVAVLVVLAIVGRPLGGALEALVSFPAGMAVTIFGWVTLVFALIETAGGRAKAADDWDPRKLPPLRDARVRPASRVGLAFELAVDAVFVAWWTAAHRSPDLFFLPPAVAPAEAWSLFYLPVLGLVLASMAVKSVVLVRPDWTSFRVGAGVLLGAAGIILAALVLSAGPLVVATMPAADGLAQILSSVLRWSIGVGAVIVLVTTALDVWRARREVGA